MSKVLDYYLKLPVLFDIIIAVIVWLTSKHAPVFFIPISERDGQLNIISNLIGTNVSLAGFVLAALTIIVTFKSNLKAKGVEESENALELILSSRHYFNIVSVFKGALIEFVICFTLLYTAWINIDGLSLQTVYRINISGIIITTLAIVRSLTMLFMIIGAEKRSS